MQTLATKIAKVDKLLDFRGEPKIGPKNNEDTQGENKQQRKGERNDKIKMKMSKGSEKKEARFRVAFVARSTMKRIVP
jgi:hypothetical protein